MPEPAQNPGPPRPPLPATVTVLASQNMGDHAARLATSHEYLPGETVEDLLRRVLPGLRLYGRTDPTDEVVLRVVVDRFGETPRTSPDLDDLRPPF